MSKVYYIGNNIDGCYYVRCLQPMIYNGWNGELTSIGGTKKTTQEAVREAMQADVVVFQRPDDKLRLKAAKILKQAGKKIVFENDDTYKNITEDMSLRKYMDGKADELDEFIKIADLVTTTTEFLADEYREINDNVVVLPNQVDPDDWEEPLRNEGKKVRIGLVGSVSNNNDYEVIAPLLEDLSKRDEVTLVLFGLPPKDETTEKLVQDLYDKEYNFWLSKDIEWQPYVKVKDYFNTLNELRLDIMLIPRQDNYFNKAKSNVKYLEASMCEIPVVAQGFLDGLSPYEDINGMNGKLAYTSGDWEVIVNKLIDDKALRLRVGKEAHKYVLKHYSIQDNFKRWAEAYNTI